MSYPQERPEPWTARVMGAAFALAMLALFACIAIGAPLGVLALKKYVTQPCTEEK